VSESDYDGYVERWT